MRYNQARQARRVVEGADAVQDFYPGFLENVPRVSFIADQTADEV